MNPETVRSAAFSSSILVVDDENHIRELMARWLSASGYAVHTAGTADEALNRVRSDAPAVALCDIRMPGHDGHWLASNIRHDAPETAVIMASGVQELDVASGLRQGIVDYLTKPFALERLRESVSRGVEWHKAARDTRRWRETLEGEVAARRQVLSEAVDSLIIDNDADLDVLLCVLTNADREAYAHAYRVAGLAATVGRAMDVDQEELRRLERAALVHDVGKFAMPDAVLRKPAPLTVEEQNLIRQHPRIASELFVSVPFLSAAAELVRDTCERVDGRGYPNGTPAADVALGARIIAVADAFDAMTRPRVFRNAVSPAEALAELERCAGTQFDAAVVAAFKQILQP